MTSQTSLLDSDAADGDSLQPLDKLEVRIQNAVTRFGEAEKRRVVAEEEAQRLQSFLADKEREVERLRSQIEELRTERDEVRGRIETLIQRIQSLEA